MLFIFKYIPILIFIIYIITFVGTLYLYFKNNHNIIFQDLIYNSNDKTQLNIPTLSLTGMENPEKNIYIGGFTLIGIFGLLLLYTHIKPKFDIIKQNNINGLNIFLNIIFYLTHIAMILVMVQGIITLKDNPLIHETTAYGALFYLIIMFTIYTFLLYFNKNNNELNISSVSLYSKIIITIFMYLSWIIFVPIKKKLGDFNWWGLTQRTVVSFLFVYIATLYLDD